MVDPKSEFKCITPPQPLFPNYKFLKRRQHLLKRAITSISFQKIKFELQTSGFVVFKWRIELLEAQPLLANYHFDKALLIFFGKDAEFFTFPVT